MVVVVAVVVVDDVTTVTTTGTANATATTSSNCDAVHGAIYPKGKICFLVGQFALRVNDLYFG